MPEAAIGADVIIGFPGETDALFEQTYRFVHAQPFTYLHLFPFSARPKTPAWEFHRQHPVSAHAVHERMAALRELIAGKFRIFREQFLGRPVSAITLERESAGSGTEAVTDHFLKLTLDAHIPGNSLIRVCVTGLTREGLRGAVIA
jgi:threonylcarbamoyladenosine tRNA methylthiotransferase MtaB